MQFQLPAFIDQCRHAAALDDKIEAHKAIVNIMETVFSDPQSVLENMPSIDKDEEILYEASDCQVWYCGFGSGVHIPPHDHGCYACIGCFEGCEVNHMYSHTAGTDSLVFDSTVRLGVGGVLQIAPDDIHSVESAPGQRSKCLHVYLGNLSTVRRHLFDWRTGQKIPFSLEKFNEFTAREDRPVTSR